MRLALCLILLCFCSQATAQVAEHIVCWDEVEFDPLAPVDGYRVYWTNTLSAFWCTDRVELTWMEACVNNSNGIGRCCDNGEVFASIPQDWFFVMMIVTSFNSEHESVTEHGPVFGNCE